MAYGIRIRNTTGSVQIDDSYQNLALRSKGTVNSGGTTTGTQWTKASIVVPASTIIAFRCSVPCMILSSVLSGATKTVTFLVQSLGAAVDWYAFDTADLGQSYGGLYGMRIRTKAGAVAFDSRMKYMRVLQQIAGTGPANAAGTYASGAGQLPAVVQGPLCYDSQTIPLTGTGSDPQVQYLFWALAVTTAASSITISRGNADALLYDRASQVPVGLVSSQQGYSFLMLDVANF